MSRDCCDKAGSIIDAQCCYDDGKFFMGRLPACLPGLFTIRFTAPADYRSGDVVVVKGKELPVRTPDMTSAGSDIFKAGAVIHCDVDMDRELAFFWQGGESCARNFSGRKLLTSNTTYYLRKDGNDDNDGLSEEFAFATWDRMHKELRTIDGAGYFLVINLGAGIWENRFDFDGRECIGFIGIQLEGQGDSTVIAPVNNHGIFIGHSSVYVFIRNLKISGAKFAIYSQLGGEVNINGPITITGVERCIFAYFGGFVHLSNGATLTIADNPSCTLVIGTHYGAFFETAAGTSVVLTGTNAGTQFARVQWNAQINIQPGTTLSGTFTGKKYTVSHGGLLGLNGITLPGTVAGTSVAPGFVG